MREFSIKEKRMMLVIMYLDQMVELGMLTATPVAMTEEGIELLNKIKEEKIELPSEDIIGCLIALGIEQLEAMMMSILINDLHTEGLDIVKKNIELAKEKFPFPLDNES